MNKEKIVEFIKERGFDSITKYISVLYRWV